MDTYLLLGYLVAYRYRYRSQAEPHSVLVRHTEINTVYSRAPARIKRPLDKLDNFLTQLQGRLVPGRVKITEKCNPDPDIKCHATK